MLFVHHFWPLWFYCKRPLRSLILATTTYSISQFSEPAVTERQCVQQSSLCREGPDFDVTTYAELSNRNLSSSDRRRIEFIRELYPFLIPIL